MRRTLPFVISLSFASKMEADLEEFFIHLTFHTEENILWYASVIQNRGFLGGKKKSHRSQLSN